MDRWDRAGTQLALLADDDRETARQARPWLLSQGLELVQARGGMAALELLQRLPESFGLALVSLDLPDIPGVVLIETLRHFRPALPVMCLTAPGQEVDFDVGLVFPNQSIGSSSTPRCPAPWAARRRPSPLQALTATP